MPTLGAAMTSRRAVMGAMGALLFCCRTVRAEKAALRSDAAMAPAPPFRLQAKDGKARTLESYRGKLLLLNFWATWCGPCREEIPALRRAQRKWGPRGVAIVGVAMDAQGWRTVTPFLSNLEAGYEIVLGTPKVARAYGAGEVYPTTVVVNPEGRVVGKITTALSDEDLDRILGAMVRELGR